MKSKLSAYCLSVHSFFEHIAWDGTVADASDDLLGSSGLTNGSEQPPKWQCMSVTQFFDEMAWDRRMQTFAADYCSIAVIHPLAMPVGHFFRNFGQQASRKVST